jgi:hypothetical protein
MLKRVIHVIFVGCLVFAVAMITENHFQGTPIGFCLYTIALISMSVSFGCALAGGILYIVGDE